MRHLKKVYEREGVRSRERREGKREKVGWKKVGERDRRGGEREKV